MNILKTTSAVALLTAAFILSSLSGCISVKREVEPTTTTTTTRSTVVPASSSTTVTTY